MPDHIIERSKRLTGWLGIQRYADPNDFGIDFIRNGRKILVSDKSLFQYENPLTGQKELQYPLELGTSIGGRIVGELHVDYLLPTYQKNDFDTCKKVLYHFRMRKWRSLLMSGWRMLLIWVTLMMRRDSHFRRDSNGKKTTI